VTKWLKANARDSGSGTPSSETEYGASPSIVSNLHLELLRPAATSWDIQTLENLWHAAERYIRLAFSGLDAKPHEHDRREHAHHELIDTFRSRDPEAVAAAVLHHLDANEQIAQRAIV
jgi:DNA-binding FadR family transcriptional regulator